ncbi:MAG: hypothetical protein M3O70_28150 [Actinomycetota bacterium]|nr:hypothetical protein [Actinomycetota bacterium]
MDFFFLSVGSAAGGIARVGTGSLIRFWRVLSEAPRHLRRAVVFMRLGGVALAVWNAVVAVLLFSAAIMDEGRFLELAPTFVAILLGASVAMVPSASLQLHEKVWR